jgi:hypothetical protein
MVVDATDELREMGLDVAQRKHGHGQKYDQKSPPRQNAPLGVVDEQLKLVMPVSRRSGTGRAEYRVVTENKSDKRL